MSLEERIKHYQRNIDRITASGVNNTDRLLHIIEVLHKLPITVNHLQCTGVGRTVNALRKIGDGVGDAAKHLVGKWKIMVAESTNSSSEEDEACVPDVPESYENEDVLDKSLQSPEMVIHTDDADNSFQYSKEENDEEPTDNLEYKVEEKEKNRHKSSSHHSRQSSSKDSSSKKHKHTSSKNKHEPSKNSENHDSKKKDKHKKKADSVEISDHAKKRRFDLENIESTENIKSKKRKTDAEEEDNDKNNVSINEEQSSEDEKYEPVQEETNYMSVDEHESKEEKKHSLKNRSKDKKSSQKGESCSDKIKSKSKHHSSSASHSDKSKKNSSSKLNDCEKNLKHKIDETQSKELKSKSLHSSFSNKSHSSKDSDKNEKQKIKESHCKNGKGDKEKSKSKSSKDKKHHKEHKEDEEHKKHKEHKKKKHKSHKEKKQEKDEIGSDDDDVKGIDGNSGTSFGEALGMCMIPPRTKKKKESTVASSSKSTSSKPNKLSCLKSSSSTINLSNWQSDDDSTDSPDALSMLSTTHKLEPLNQICNEVDISATLPEPCLNYKPLPQINSTQRKWDEDILLSQVIHAKTQRTKVYSGNKSGYSKVPTLFDLCIRVLIENIDALDATGGVPYHILKPALVRATADQLLNLEFYNDYLLEDTDELWKNHCNKEFRTKKKEENETWREMFLRCRDEREAKFKALTANIKQSIDNSQPVRSTKLAYVDHVKPPRNVLRKQARFGTANVTSKSSEAKKKIIAAASGAGGSGIAPVGEKVPAIIPLGRSRNQTTSAIKKPKAPLMMKTLQALKGRFKR